MAHPSIADGIRGRELVASISAAELFLVAVWCVLGLLFKLFNAGFEVLENILGKKLGQQGSTKSVKIRLDDNCNTSQSISRDLGLAGSGATRKKWRQVADYIPDPPDAVNGRPTEFHKPRSTNKAQACILCPGPCICREYLIGEMWQARMTGISSKSR